jgi:hypothetical protein
MNLTCSLPSPSPWVIALVIVSLVLVLIQMKRRYDNFALDRSVQHLLSVSCQQTEHFSHTSGKLNTQHESNLGLESESELEAESNTNMPVITQNDFGWDHEFPVKSCSNSSITNRLRTGPKQLLPSRIACHLPNKLTAENYYRTHYMAMPIPLEDAKVKGSNYEEYSKYIHPTRLNLKILSANTKTLADGDLKFKNIPVGYNYAFHNTPAMAMP